MTVELAGTGPLKILHTVNIDMWRHPKYYKNLRKLARLRNRDQAISLQAETSDAGRTPGTGQSSKQQAEDIEINLERVQKQYTSSKHQASSLKHQAVQKK